MYHHITLSLHSNLVSQCKSTSCVTDEKTNHDSKRNEGGFEDNFKLWITPTQRNSLPRLPLHELNTPI